MEKYPSLSGESKNGGKALFVGLLFNLFVLTNTVSAQDKILEKFYIKDGQVDKVLVEENGKYYSRLKVYLNKNAPRDDKVIFFESYENGLSVGGDTVDIFKGDTIFVALSPRTTVVVKDEQTISLHEETEYIRALIRENPMDYIIESIVHGKEIAPNEDLLRFTRTLKSLETRELIDLFVHRILEKGVRVNRIIDHNLESAGGILLEIEHVNKDGIRARLVVVCTNGDCDYDHGFGVIYGPRRKKE